MDLSLQGIDINATGLITRTIYSNSNLPLDWLRSPLLRGAQDGEINLRPIVCGSRHVQAPDCGAPASGFRRGAPGAHRLQLYARTTEEGGQPIDWFFLGGKPLARPRHRRHSSRTASRGGALGRSGRGNGAGTKRTLARLAAGIVGTILQSKTVRRVMSQMTRTC